MLIPLLAAVSLGIYYERIAVSLGFATLGIAIATFVTCRTFASVFRQRTGRDPLQNGAYRAFYRYHSYYWWSFIVIMLVHVLSALMHTDLLPPPDDPDYVGHWFILAFAFGSVGAFAVQFASCRTFTGMLELFTGRLPLGWRIYRGFYRFHTWYWWFFLAAVGGHVIAAAIHTHFWPGWGPA